MRGSSGERALARRLWNVLEPIHATVYFAPEVHAGYRAVGLRGFWMGYFAGRAHPLGRASPEVVAATFFNFHPAMVRRALPNAWHHADPGEVGAARLAGIDVALRRLLGDRIDSAALPEAADLAETAAAGCSIDGRPLFAAHAALPPPGPPHLRLWHAATLLREHRGDGHVVANVSRGVSGLASHVLFAATGAVSRSTLQDNRGWSDQEWQAAEEDLTGRGWLRDRRLTDTGRRLRRDVEDLTDDLAVDLLRPIGSAGGQRLIDLAQPLADRIVSAGGIPVPNPMGVPWPPPR
jgi:hypothetical protein